jgi:uncharacterized protein with FMN-binding domain
MQPFNFRSRNACFRFPCRRTASALGALPRGNGRRPADCAWQALLVALLLVLLRPAPSRGQDVVEFLSGARSEGKVIQIHKEKREVVFEMTIAGRAFRSTYPYSKLHAVTYQGKRYVLNKRASQGSAEPGAAGASRSAEEVMQLIAAEGRRPPDWFNSTTVEYPPSLDLDWPQPPPQPWDNQKNVGQYVWDILNPNPGKWRSGIRFMHFMLNRSADDPGRARRAMEELGSMYFRYFQDYARAAFWWQKAQVKPGSQPGVALAECYWRLGSKQLALKQLETRTIRVEMVKLLGEMGDTQRATRMAETLATKVRDPQWALLAAGDACRSAGEFQKAMAYYNRVLAADAIRNPDYDQRARSRAQQSIEAIRLFELLDISQVPDGKYIDESLGYEGPIEVTVTVRGGRIEQVDISKHREKQFYSALRDIPEQIIAKQSIKNIDATSRATITAEAIVSATAKALSSATAAAASGSEN